MRTSLVIALLLLLSCGPESNGPTNRFNQPTSRTLFSKSITSVTIEIDYSVDAEPYTGSVDGIGDVWGLFRANVVRVFEKSSKKLVVPTTLEGMEALHDIRGRSFSAAQILKIADVHRDTKNTASAASFYVIWLPGHFSEDGKVLNDVLGVSIGDTGVIAMFKEVVVTASARAALNVSRFIEQSTLIHEFGHSIGLVNSGISLTSAHQDTRHDAHCTNTACAMFWENDGQSASKFARQFVDVLCQAATQSAGERHHQQARP